MPYKEISTFTVNQLLFVQAHLGNKTSKWNPLTKSFLFGSRHGVHFFDLKQTTPYIKRVLFLLSKATKNHQIILFIGTHPFVSVLVKFLASNTKQSSISRKWVAGTLTNWLKIRSYVRFLYRTNIAQIKKKFVLKTEKKIEQKISQYLKMKYLLAGIEKMPTLPNLVVILEKDNTTKSTQAGLPFFESFTLMIPIISIINTGPRSGLGIAYPVFGNDYLFDSLFFYGNLMLHAIRTGLIQKRLVFLKTYPIVAPINSTFSLNLLSKNKYSSKSEGSINNNFFLISQFFFGQKKGIKSKFLYKHFFRVYRSYKVLACKRALRYFSKRNFSFPKAKV